MPNPDPYTVLDVPKDADQETIRRAHRRKAKRCHKDAGGNDDQMRAVNEAWMVLRDPERRQRYDQTGQTDEKDTTMQRFVGLFLQAVEAVLDQPGVDPINLLRQKLANMRHQVESHQKELAKKAAAHRRIKRRGQNLLQQVMENHATGLERQAEAAKNELEDIAKMKELLEGYQFEAEPVTFTTFKTNGKSPHIGFSDEMEAMLRQFGI
jgi:curved DNA-binding protein CbpA